MAQNLRNSFSLLSQLGLLVLVIPAIFTPSITLGQSKKAPVVHVSFEYSWHVERDGSMCAAMPGITCTGSSTLAKNYSASATLTLQPDGSFRGTGKGHLRETSDDDWTITSVQGCNHGSGNTVLDGPVEVTVTTYGDDRQAQLVQVYGDSDGGMYYEENSSGCDEEQHITNNQASGAVGCNFADVDLTKGGRYTLHDTGMEGDTCTLDITPVDEMLRIFGTARGLFDKKGTKPLTNSKVVLANIDKTPDLEALSSSKPGFIKETVTSEDADAEYEFIYSRPDTSKLPKMLVVSLLWSGGKSVFAVTNGNEINGRFIPVYQALCVDDDPSTLCTKWKRSADGSYEAEVNFEYGSPEKLGQALSFMKMEAYVGPASTAQLMKDAAYIFYNSNLGMKYFESLGLGIAFEPLMIQAYHDLPDCPGAGAYFASSQKASNASPSFGDLGNTLEKVTATGAAIYICQKDSSIHQVDAPVNREWHELGHYFLWQIYLPDNKGGFHKGYANPGTEASLIEGFAEFTAVLINEHVGSKMPNLYPVGDSFKNIELNFKPWGEPLDEELALAGTLWDFHDAGKEIALGFVNSNGGMVKISQVYPTPTDQVSLGAKEIMQVIKRNKPKTMFDLYTAFSGNLMAQTDLDMITVEHGFFADIVERNYIQDSLRETIGESGNAPDRPIRQSPVPVEPGSYLVSDADTSFEIAIIHREPFGEYDYTYKVDMAKGERIYFTMSPQYYPSRAVITPLSGDCKKLPGSIEIDSKDYWNYIASGPAKDGIFKKISLAPTATPRFCERPQASNDG